MVINYYNKLFCTEANKYNGILMYLLLLVAETIIKQTTFADIEFFVFFQFWFQRNHIFNEKDNPSQKFVIAEEENS